MSGYSPPTDLISLAAILAKATPGVLTVVQRYVGGGDTMYDTVRLVPMQRSALGSFRRADGEALAAAFNWTRDYGIAEIEALVLANSKLQAFKDFVHRRLDAAGVPTHPDGVHSAEGCRIGDRLDSVLETVDILSAVIDAWDGLAQTQMAASEIGVELANSFRNEGYGLQLRIAMRDARQALGAYKFSGSGNQGDK